jgi:geranylgeranyl diphosphate synthase type II
MVGGQTLDVLLTDKPMNEAQLDFIFKLKTGALLEASFIIGATLAGANAETIKILSEVGKKVGMAFQIQDDILDVISTQEVLGKPVMSDEKNNKTTYVTLYGMDKALADVESLSQEAIGLLKTIGSNEFLEQLILKLINREK